MASGVYGIFSTTGECLYVGQSSNIYIRWGQHIKELRSGRHKRVGLVDYFNSVGEDGLEFRVLSLCVDSQDLKNQLEILMFNKYSPKFFGQTPSSKVSFGHSEETKRKISKTLFENSSDIRYTKICVCGNEIVYTKSRTRTFCSAKCSYSSRPRPTDKIDPKDLQSKYESGMSLEDLGKLYGFSYRTIHQFMVRNNIPRRSISESLKLNNAPVYVGLEP